MFALLPQRLAQRNIVVKRFDEIPMADIEVRWAAFHAHVCGMHVQGYLNACLSAPGRPRS